MARTSTRVCREPGCPNLEPCPVHVRAAWAGSQRKTLLTLTPAQRARAHRNVRRRNPSGICHRCGLPGADVVDHVVALSEGGEDAEANMALIHERPCHAAKTGEESARARARRRA